MNNLLQAWDRGLGTTGREAVTSGVPMIVFFFLLPFLQLLFTSRGSQVEEERLVLRMLLSFLPPGLRLSLIVQQQVWVVMAMAVSHHHRTNGAGIDVLDLEEALDHIDVFWFDVLKEEKYVIL